MSRLSVEITKFTAVGALNAGLTFVVFFSLLKLGEIHYLAALASAWVVGVAFSYVANYLWVFLPDERLRFNERFIKYFLASLLSFFLNVLLLNLVVERLGWDPFFVQTALVPCIVVFNFLTAKLWSLGSGKR